jgi:DMSO/TMAO reductase YedYZ molybdopterin-dependent catalytic subunit
MSEQRRFVTQSPENSETPLAEVRGWVTPTRLFFVRNHFDVPQLEASAWRLAVGGCVERPLELSWEELNDLPQRTVLATLECAGNGRSFLAQKAAGRCLGGRERWPMPSGRVCRSAKCSNWPGSIMA